MAEMERELIRRDRQELSQKDGKGRGEVMMEMRREAGGEQGCHVFHVERAGRKRKRHTKSYSHICYVHMLSAVVN